MDRMYKYVKGDEECNVNRLTGHGATSMISVATRKIAPSTRDLIVTGSIPTT
jgi:hypothetical protein